MAVPTTSNSGGSSSSNRVFVGVGIGVGLLLFVTFLVWFLRKRKRKMKMKMNNLPLPKHHPKKKKSKLWSVSLKGILFAIESLTVYKYDELLKATGDFSEDNRVKGSVYRGTFNGDFAAVKIKIGSVSGEINMLKKINHLNIIRLSGFCLHHGNTYLVYEFASNGSLSDWLHSYDSVLGWKQRVQIAHDVADALNYLHNFITPPYVHKNLKSSNVLIDARMRGKITNFGLARSVDEKDDEELQLTRHVVGTYGYMPPEYIHNGLITPKMDVFALGVLMAELLSGKKAATRSLEIDEKEVNIQLSEMLKEAVGGDKLAEFMDSKLEDDYPVELAYSMAEVACKCVAEDLNERPSVTEVLLMLSKITSCSLDWDPSDEVERSTSLTHGR